MALEIITPQQVCAALKALYHNPDPDLKKQANDWLSHFQKKPEAWQVADRILQTVNLPSENYYFAANALRFKLQYSFKELPDSGSRLSFRDSLLKNLLNFKKGPPIVRNCLAFCLANLAIHLVAHEWKDAFPALINLLGKPETAVVLLDVLTGIPEECLNERLHISREHRKAASVACKNVSAYVLKILTSYFQSAGNNHDLHHQVLKCFLAWIRQGFMLSEGEQKLLLCPPGNLMLSAPFDCLSISTLFPIAADIIAELLRQCEDAAKHHLILNYLFPRILALESLYDKVAGEGDQQASQKLSLIFIELGESYLDWIVELSPQAQQTLRIILKIGRHPSKDIAVGTFNFWYVLVIRLTGHRSENYEPEEDEEVGQSRKSNYKQPLSKEKLQMFFPFYTEYFDVITYVMRFPLDVDTWTDDQRDDYKRFRYFAAEALIDTTYVFGTDICLSKIISLIEKEFVSFSSNPKHWHSLEAALYCARSIARRVNHHENPAIRKIMELVTRITGHSSLRYTCTLIIGRYSDWIHENPNYVPVALQYIVHGLNDAKVISSAALAFKHVCDGCVQHLAKQYFSQLLVVYNSSFSLQFSDQKDIIEGISRVVSALPKDHIMNGFWVGILSPVISQMNLILGLGSNPGTNSQQPVTDISVCLDILSQIFKSMDPKVNAERNLVSACLVEVLKRLWRYFPVILEKYKTCNRTMEKLCRVWKYSIKTVRMEFSPLLQPLLTLCSDFFNQYPHSSFLYCMCTCIDHFSNTQFQGLLENMFGIFSQRTLQILKNSESFRDHPDIVEDFFDLVVRYTRRCPQSIFSNPILTQIFACATQGLGVHHKQSLSGVTQFFAVVIERGIDARNGPAPAQYKTIIATLLQQHGDSLVKSLIAGITDVLPMVRIKFTLGVFQALINFNREIAKAHLTAALIHIPETQKPSKTEFLQKLLSARDRGTMREAIYTFATVARRG